MKQTIQFLFLAILTGLMMSCQPTVKEQTEATEVNNDGLLLATLYMQQSSEYQALCKQVYLSGKMQLDKKMETFSSDKKPAIVVDIDETVLDNSPFSAISILENTDYPMYWDAWCEKAEAKAIPGAMEFLRYAADLGVETFYISNRKVHLYEPTLKNLRNQGFPFTDEDHILLRTDTRDKEPRRAMVKADYDIILFFGDNLGDFASDFDDKPTKERKRLVNEHESKFGVDYFVLPNPTYGAWMEAMKANMGNSENIDSLYKSKLISF